MRETWSEFIDKDIYRVTSEEYLPEILEKGIDPNKDPFEGMYQKFNLLFKLMQQFEDEGKIYTEEWVIGEVTANHIIEVNKASREGKYIDFVADYKQAQHFSQKWKGGALTNIIYNFTSFLLKQKLSSKEKELVESLHTWSIKKRSYPNRIIAVRGSSRVFEKATMLLLPKNKERENVGSPYGSFEHFTKNTKEELVDYYTLKELSYLRVTEKIPKEEIKIITENNK